MLLVLFRMCLYNKRAFYVYSKLSHVVIIAHTDFNVYQVILGLGNFSLLSLRNSLPNKEKSVIYSLSLSLFFFFFTE